MIIWRSFLPCSRLNVSVQLSLLHLRIRWVITTKGIPGIISTTDQYWFCKKPSQHRLYELTCSHSDDPIIARKPIRQVFAKSASPSATRRVPVATARSIIQSSDSDDSHSAHLHKPSHGSPAKSKPSSKKPPRSAARRVILSSDSEDHSFYYSPTPLATKTNVVPQIEPPKIPRRGKKALAAAEQARRESYATQLFNDLNQTVFSGGLPSKTKLVWSKRLLTTAGRAKWHRSRDGVETSEIELASKILDSDERIRNTLSHEMCHLACWVINNNIREGHGKEFKAWAAKVTKTRSDIRISTRHTYEIAYAYEWKCEKCDKIYGRHSKSIRPDECVCGACKEGRLIPLFTQRTPKVSKASKLVATIPQGTRPLASIIWYLRRGILIRCSSQSKASFSLSQRR
ncbi:hypothetical protein CONPUDRAFT_46822 [Coniophora puteana RWD-64-598 SS2]|uniref:SprT-like domain-containing protein n=1 Tax=Coniophora puteana (strain RWD-64-598) TaxID=741705 RepID=A0A5M3N4T4_CONPW|nr:uncharacterized protein CONPUDRAFT_46822 [Coniophora puteana RWD-64-598 SS2]EIW86403.1 hypothetical protein CONPUDRAFT_46822 [Coniophora puteana RWD-64-598 SS2]